MPYTESNKYLLSGWHAATFYVCISMVGHINSLFTTPDTTFKLVKATQFAAYQSILSWSFSRPLSNVNAKEKGRLPIFFCLLFIMDFWFITLCFCDMILMYSAQIDGWFSILYCNSLASCLTHFFPTLVYEESAAICSHCTHVSFKNSTWNVTMNGI